MQSSIKRRSKCIKIRAMEVEVIPLILMALKLINGRMMDVVKGDVGLPV
jgi:hypothetical protein